MSNYPFLLVIGYIGVVMLVSEYSPKAGGAMIILLVLLMWRRLA